jgi:hypothetical protein
VLQHVLDREALDHDRLVLTNQFGGELVLIVFSAISNAGMDARLCAAASRGSSSRIFCGQAAFVLGPAF